MLRLSRFSPLLVTVLLTITLCVLPGGRVSADGDGPGDPPGHYLRIGDQEYADPVWWTQNAINQIAQDTFDEAGQIVTNPFNTCGPASLAMVINFYRPADHPPVTTQEVMRSIQKAGFYNPPEDSGFLGYPALDAAAARFGIRPEAPGVIQLSFSDLLAGVRTGRPAIVAMRYGYTPSGEYVPQTDGFGPTNHFVVVFGTLIADGQEAFWVLNTHPAANLREHQDARPVTLDFATFQAAWLARPEGEVGLGVFYRPAR